MNHDETIVAQVTCPGKSSVGILRVSGVYASRVSMKILGKIPRARFATYAKFLGNNKKILDQGISLWFPSPYSFTGEDVLELQGHGSPLIIDLLMQRILSIKGVRIAQPGEFCQRAFLNNKIDLVQAEAIDDLINADTESMIQGSLNSLQGNFSLYITKLIKKIIDIRISIESSIDFSEESIHVDTEDVISLKLDKLYNQFIKIKKIVTEGSIIRELKKIAIVGPPNAGKSSLLNVLSCRNRAIVTNVPGTTRDAIYEDIKIHDIAYQIIDTAGLRNTIDIVEKIGIQRSWDIIQQADHVLFVIDKTINVLDQRKISTEFMKKISLYKNNIQVTFILNKNDLTKDVYGIERRDNLTFISISTYTGEGLDILKKFLTKTERNKNQHSIFIARRRHIHQIDLSFNEFLKAQKHWLKYKNIEFLAESLNIINKLLGVITGTFTSKDLLNRIFSTFCIGK